MLVNGSWSLASQLLALEEWRPNFKLSRDGVHQARVWVRLPDLLVDLWDKKKILKIAFTVGKPLLLDEWTENNIRMGYARVCVLIDASQLVCPAIKIKINNVIMWQEFIYEELLEICYNCGHILSVPTASCKCFEFLK